MKLVLGLLVISFVSMAQSNSIWDQLSRCEQSCSVRCNKLFADLRSELEKAESSCTSTEPVDQNLYKEIYSYATSSTGLWLSADKARQFTEEMMGTHNVKAKFPVFKNAYSYATSSTGLWLSAEKAREFALKLMQTRNAERALSCYKEAYSYATSSTGLWLSAEKAREHAEKMCKL
ncbi:MAG: hypothetical protein JNL11_08205 [Bdellovibrionaceae bacterium]|nr:hypothetical protein [Pseudobdellovibrionaceae bacterium]